MTTGNQDFLKAGDWVSGTTSIDEKFIGYVHSVNESGFVTVWVTQSDHEEILGYLVDSRLGKVKKLPVYNPETKDDLEGLIELALMTRDQAWFDTLAAKLNETAAPKGERANGRFDNLGIHNRMRYGIRSE
jgi:hypothetical protein